jgi:hypothetical protein
LRQTFYCFNTKSTLKFTIHGFQMHIAVDFHYNHIGVLS